jgi:hypothetical protein
VTSLGRRDIYIYTSTETAGQRDMQNLNAAARVADWQGGPHRYAGAAARAAAATVTDRGIRSLA